VMNCSPSYYILTTVFEDATVKKTIVEKFPGAIKTSDLAYIVKSKLSENGFIDAKTLLATSLCCDEVNREMEQDFTSLYKHNFSMGGLAGFAFGGVTSFGAMAHHIPDDGSCLIIYGPHVGIDRDGVVGKVNRRGRRNGSGICCGSAAAAAGYCMSVKEGVVKPSPVSLSVDDSVDAQQTFVANLLLPYTDRISKASDPNVELPMALFDVQSEFMTKIVDKGCGEVAGEGKIAILGGVQINTPEGTSEYFLPKVFEIRDNKGALVIDMIQDIHIENIPRLLTVEDDGDDYIEEIISSKSNAKGVIDNLIYYIEEKKDEDIMVKYDSSSNLGVPPSLSLIGKWCQDPTVTNTIASKFPGAVKSADLAKLIKSVLHDNGFDDAKTLLATSLCCDEVNREMEQDFTSMYKYNFSMGGLAGFAFGGVTSFGAMAHHIPDDGSCLIIFGPHVGVDRDGVVGKVNRRGRCNGSGICCGSAAAAAGYCRSVKEGTMKPSPHPNDAVDAQQTFVGNMLLPHADRISSSSDPNVELPMALFDVQSEFMRRIVQKACGEVAGEGKIAILGGVQINTPEGTSEYFLPKVFEIRDNKGALIKDVICNVTVNDLENIPHLLTIEEDDGDDYMEEINANRASDCYTEEKKDDDVMIKFNSRSKICVPPTLSSNLKIFEDATVTNTIALKFPGAVKSADLAKLIKSVLHDNGFDDAKTLLATSLCCDEVNREMEQDFTSLYKHNFSMGGLAGFAFGGVTSFGAMAHHIPDDGSCLIIFGPHVGVDRDGVVGKVNRRGRCNGSGICCGSATAAAGYCRSVKEGTVNPSPYPDDAVDAQQTYVGNLLLPHADRISCSSDPNVELPMALFDVQHEFMRRIVDKACGEVAGEGKIAILGGVQINTPEGTSEYFLPKVFEIRDNSGMLVANLMYKLVEAGYANTQMNRNITLSPPHRREKLLLDRDTCEIICDMDESDVSINSQRDTLKHENHIVTLFVGVELFLLFLYFTLCK